MREEGETVRDPLSLVTAVAR